jgi:Double-GTPase 1
MSGSDSKVRIALFGESDNGKSHYGAQLLERIEAEKCEIKLRVAAADVSAFDEVRRRLGAGLLAEHTPSGVYQDVILPVVDAAGRAMDLTWPDYAGEQVGQLIDSRAMKQEWLDRTQAAHGWILIVRPKLAKGDDDIFSKPLAHVVRGSEGEAKKPRRSVQARLVELLQMLLHARGLHERGQVPPLVVLLSCWDELNLPEGAKPGYVLNEQLPLLASFVRSNWGARASVLGLSALGVELDKERVNGDFIDRGPENSGFVVEADGRSNPDLTIPIVRLADMSRN